MELIGKGLYSISEVSKWTGIPSSAIRRWVLGYQTNTLDSSVLHPPVFVSELPRQGERITLSFLDLVELRFIHEFRKQGVSWKVIRESSEEAVKILGALHPFAQKKLYTDKKAIFLRMVNGVGDPTLLDLYHRQFEMDEVVFPLLFESLDFDQFDVASRWWPLGKDHEVVLDPARNFGKPIVSSARVPTEALYAAYKVEKSVERVADWFEVSPAMVHEAIAFQERTVA